jgi:hypothetical protein
MDNNNKTENKSIKLANDVKEAVAGFDLARQLTMDKAYRNVAVVSSVILIVAVFFISLASANFDWNALNRAQFWIDFVITFFGAIYMKYIWGVNGNYEGNNNPKVIDALLEVEQTNKLLEDNKLLEALEAEVDYINKSNKIKSLRKRTFYWLSWFPKNTKLKVRKQGIILFEEYLKTKDETRQEEILNKLDDLGFNLDSYKTDAPLLKVEYLQMGFANGGSTVYEQYSYNATQQLFGKQVWTTIMSFVFTALIAVVSLVSNEITLATISLFATRVFIYSINGFFGFTTGKQAVETVRYTVLKNISRFLKTFIEKMKEVKK